MKFAIFSKISSEMNRLNIEYALIISRSGGRFSCGACLFTDNEMKTSFSTEVISAVTSSSFCFQILKILLGEIDAESEESAESNRQLVELPIRLDSSIELYQSHPCRQLQNVGR